MIQVKYVISFQELYIKALIIDNLRRLEVINKEKENSKKIDLRIDKYKRFS